VVEVRAGRVAMVREFLATVTSDGLASTHKNPWDPEYRGDHPWDPEYQETTLSCLHVILEEEWEHHRYAYATSTRSRRDRACGQASSA
jgi:hypothetical protein